MFLPPIGGDRRLHEPQPTMVYPQLGYPHRAGRYRPGGKPLSFPMNWSRRHKEGVLFRGWDRILPGCLVASRNPVNPLSARGVGVSTLRSGLDPDDHRFRPRFIGVVHLRRYFGSGYGILSVLALSTPGWGFNTARGGIHRGNHRFRPRFVRVVYV